MTNVKNFTVILSLMMVSLLGFAFPSGSAFAAVNTMDFESDWFDLEAGVVIPGSIPPGDPPTAACDFHFAYNSHRVPHAVIFQNQFPYPGVEIAYSDEDYADVTYSDVAGLAFTPNILDIPFDKVAVLLTTEGNYFKVGPVSENDGLTVTFEWEPLPKMLGDVVVDGQTKSFNMYDVIHNLKVKNGGDVFAKGSTIQNDVTIEGSGSKAKFSSVFVGNNITVRNAGAFTVEYSTIDNDLKGDKAGQINVWQTTVGNNLRLQECAGFAGYISEVGNDLEISKGGPVLVHVFQIGGNARILENTGVNWDYAAIIYSSIGKDLTVSKNKMGSQGYVKVEGNNVGGNFKCTENEPTTIVSGNTVVGSVTLD